MPKTVCGKWMSRANKPCLLLVGHKGHCRHDSVWYCESCSKPRTGFPAARDPDIGWFCFMCQLDTLKHYGMVK